MDRASRSDEFGDQIQDLIDQLSEQALDFARKEYGNEHPVWQSIHDQLEAFRSEPPLGKGNQKKITH